MKQEKTKEEHEKDRVLMERHLSFMLHISGTYLALLNGHQDSLKRFLFCCVEKLHKSAIALERLYALVHELPDFEFSMGIIFRSLLMDSF